MENSDGEKLPDLGLIQQTFTAVNEAQDRPPTPSRLISNLSKKSSLEDGIEDDFNAKIPPTYQGILPATHLNSGFGSRQSSGPPSTHINRSPVGERSAQDEWLSLPVEILPEVVKQHTRITELDTMCYTEAFKSLPTSLQEMNTDDLGENYVKLHRLHNALIEEKRSQDENFLVLEGRVGNIVKENIALRRKHQYFENQEVQSTNTINVLEARIHASDKEVHRLSKEMKTIARLESETHQAPLVARNELVDFPALRRDESNSQMKSLLDENNRLKDEREDFRRIIRSLQLSSEQLQKELFQRLPFNERPSLDEEFRYADLASYREDRNEKEVTVKPMIPWLQQNNTHISSSGYSSPHQPLSGSPARNTKFLSDELGDMSLSSSASEQFQDPTGTGIQSEEHRQGLPSAFTYSHIHHTSNEVESQVDGQSLNAVSPTAPTVLPVAEDQNWVVTHIDSTELFMSPQTAPTVDQSRSPGLMMDGKSGPDSEPAIPSNHSTTILLAPGLSNSAEQHAGQHTDVELQKANSAISTGSATSEGEGRRKTTHSLAYYGLSSDGTSLHSAELTNALGNAILTLGGSFERQVSPKSLSSGGAEVRSISDKTAQNGAEQSRLHLGSENRRQAILDHHQAVANVETSGPSPRINEIQTPSPQKRDSTDRTADQPFPEKVNSARAEGLGDGANDHTWWHLPGLCRWNMLHNLIQVITLVGHHMSRSVSTGSHAVSRMLSPFESKNSSHLNNYFAFPYDLRSVIRKPDYGSVKRRPKVYRVSVTQLLLIWWWMIMIWLLVATYCMRTQWADANAVRARREVSSWINERWMFEPAGSLKASILQTLDQYVEPISHFT